MLTNTAAVNVNYAVLTVDNTGLLPIAGRLGSTPINLNQGTVTLLARMGNDSMTFGPLNVAQGAGTIATTLYNNNQTGGLSATFVSLSQTPGATINFAAPTNGGTLGAGGETAAVYFSSAPALTNGIIGGWAVVNGADFASYSAVGGVTAPGVNGVCELHQHYAHHGRRHRQRQPGHDDSGKHADG